MIADNFKFPNSRGIELAGRIYRGEKQTSTGVIFSHGLFSSKDGYKITRMASAIVDAGYTLMTFDFTFCGESPGSIRDISIIDEVDDLLCAVDYFRDTGIERLHLMGSSMGAAVSILAASRGLFSLESLILIATPLSFVKLVPDVEESRVKDLDPAGYTSIAGIEVNNRFIREIFETDMVAAVKRIDVPSLLFHGKLDMVVDFSNLGIFLENSPATCESIVVDDGDHNLTRDSDIEIISEGVRNWLGKFSL